MTYASLWSFSYFTFTLNQLLTPDTREYVCTKIWALHRYSFWCRSADFEICLCVIIALQFTQSYLMSAMKPCTYSQLIERVLCTSLRLAGHGLAMGFSLRKGRKRYLKVDHGWPWLVSQPWLTMVWQRFLNHSQLWLTMVWQSFSKPWSTMVNHRFVKWHLSQLWLTMVGKSIVNHG